MPSHRFLNPDVLVRAVLVVVEVHDRETDGGHLQHVAEQIERHAAADRRQPDDRTAGSVRDGLADGARDRRLHRAYAPRDSRRPRATLAIRGCAARVAASGSFSTMKKPCFAMWATSRSNCFAGSMPLTKRRSSLRLAEAGMIVRPCPPTPPPESIALMFSVGRLWRSSSRSAASRTARSRRLHQGGLRRRNLVDGLPLHRGQRHHIIVEPVDRRRGRASSFIEASSRASASAGFGAQLP